MKSILERGFYALKSASVMVYVRTYGRTQPVGKWHHTPVDRVQAKSVTSDDNTSPAIPELTSAQRGANVYGMETSYISSCGEFSDHSKRSREPKQHLRETLYLWALGLQQTVLSIVSSLNREHGVRWWHKGIYTEFKTSFSQLNGKNVLYKSIKSPIVEAQKKQASTIKVMQKIEIREHRDNF